MHDPDAPPELDPERIENLLSADVKRLERQVTWVATATSVFSLVLVAAVAAWAGYSYGVSQASVRTVERIGDPRMNMRITVGDREVTAYVHPVRRSSDTLSVPDVTFAIELPDALRALPDSAFCGPAAASTLCRPHLARLGPDSTAYVMEPEAGRLGAGSPDRIRDASAAD